MINLHWLQPELAHLELNDPGKLNCMGEAMSVAFAKKLEELRARTPRAIILSGAGRSFSAGGDLEMLSAKAERSVEVNQKDMLGFYHSFLDLLKLEVPLIAAVQGWSVGAGCCLAAACDLRIGDPNCRFKVPFLELGLFPGMGSTYWFRQRLGPFAADFLLTRRALNAQQALERGLLTQVSEPGGALALAQQEAEGLLCNGAQVSRALLRVLRGPLLPLEQALVRESELQAQSYARDEFREGLARARKVSS